MVQSVIYARVSPTTHIKTANDMHQSLEESINICTKDADHEGNQIIKVYKDEYVSGKSSKDMPQFNQMLSDAKQGLFKRVYCRRVNRFGRNRKDMITAEMMLSEIGVSIKFIENGIDTAKPFGKSIMAILAELAEQERDEIQKNTERGRDRLRAGLPSSTGRPWGHPKKEVNVKSIRQLRMMPINERPTWKQLSKDYKVSISSMIQRLKDAGYWDENNRCVK